MRKKSSVSAQRISAMRGLIDRRILVNFQVDPEILAQILPRPFRPKLIRGVGIAGICLIRLKEVRPRFLPPRIGISSENAAHRIAVEWEQDGQTCEGVYIPRRDTNSWVNTWAGGRLFPGVHHHARFDVQEQDGYYRVVLDSDDDQTHVAIEGRMVFQLPNTSVFRSLAEASDFFEHGSLGYSAADQAGAFEGLELRTLDWRLQPLAVACVESSFFEDQKLFPAGSVRFDSAFLMRHVEHEWHARPVLCPGYASV